LAQLIARRVPVNLASLYGPATDRSDDRTTPTAGRSLQLAVGGQPFRVPRLPERSHPSVSAPNGSHPAVHTNGTTPRRATRPMPAFARLSQQMVATETANSEAHAVFLRASAELAQTMSNQMAFQMALIESLLAEPSASLGVETLAEPLPAPPTAVSAVLD